MRVPAAVGVNVTLMVQLLPAAKVPPQVPKPPKANSLALVPLIVKLLNVSVEPLLLVSVEVPTVLVVPTS